MVERLIYCTIAHCCYMNAQYYNQVPTIIPNCDMSTNIKTSCKLRNEKVNVRGKYQNKYFELKNSWGADGVPQTRTTC